MIKRVQLFEIFLKKEFKPFQYPAFIMDYNTEENKNWDIIFLKELMEVYETTKTIVIHETDESKIKSGLKVIADKFYSTFSDSPIPVEAPTPELYMNDNSLLYSTTIKQHFSCFMIPYFFYSVLIENKDFNFDEEFSLKVSWNELIGLINQKWAKERKKLTKTEVMMCKVLSRYNVKGQKYVFPITAEIIANRTRQSLSIVKLTHPTLYLRSIINDFFLINPWKLGWELYLVAYNRSKDKEFSAFENLTLSKEPLLNNQVFRIIQQPRTNDYNENTGLIKLCKSISANYTLLDQTTFHWDINQLETKEINSFSQPPNFLSTPLEPIVPDIVFSYEDEALDWWNLISEVKRKNSKRTSKKSTGENKRSSSTNLNNSRVLSILNYLIDRGFTLRSLDTTAKMLDIPIVEFNKLLHYLIQSEVIALAHRFLFIGAGNEYSFIIQNGSEELFELVTQSLLQCPFSYFYHSKTTLAGRCQVPNNWVDKFFEFFVRFQSQYPHLEINIGPRLKGINLFNPNVKMPENYILNEFGMKEDYPTNLIRN